MRVVRHFVDRVSVLQTDRAVAATHQSLQAPGAIRDGTHRPQARTAIGKADVLSLHFHAGMRAEIVAINTKNRQYLGHVQELHTGVVQAQPQRRALIAFRYDCHSVARRGHTGERGIGFCHNAQTLNVHRSQPAQNQGIRNGQRTHQTSL